MLDALAAARGVQKSHRAASGRICLFSVRWENARRSRLFSFSSYRLPRSSGRAQRGPCPTRDGNGNGPREIVVPLEGDTKTIEQVRLLK